MFAPTKFLPAIQQRVESPIGAMLARRLQPARQWLMLHGDRVLPPLAALLILASIAMPYWQLNLHAPQYPRGLHVTLWVHKVEGDIQELNGLNHYIGMAPLDEGGQLERSLAPFAIPVVAALAALVALRRRFSWLLALPAIGLPLAFVADLFFWLYRFGHTLDPRAALSSSIHEFTPMLLGPGEVGQFRTVGLLHVGFFMALAAAAMLVAAILIRRRRNRATAEADSARDEHTLAEAA